MFPGNINRWGWWQLWMLRLKLVKIIQPGRLVLCNNILILINFIILEISSNWTSGLATPVQQEEQPGVDVGHQVGEVDGHHGGGHVPGPAQLCSDQCQGS